MSIVHLLGYPAKLVIVVVYRHQNRIGLWSASLCWYGKLNHRKEAFVLDAKLHCPMSKVCGVFSSWDLPSTSEESKDNSNTRHCFRIHWPTLTTTQRKGSHTWYWCWILYSTGVERTHPARMAKVNKRLRGYKERRTLSHQFGITEGYSHFRNQYGEFLKL